MNFLAFADLHLHKFPYANTTEHGDNELLISGLSILDQVYNYAVRYKIKYMFFLGDLFHIRPKVDSDVYCKIAYQKFCDLFSQDGSPNLIIIPGNHDQIEKSGTHKLLPYSKIHNVTVINDFYKRGNLILCPHQYKIENLYEYLRKNSDENSIVFMHQLLMNTPLMNGQIFRKNEAVDFTQFKYGCVFSGHNHRPFKNDELKIYNIGSPMHYDFGDAECQERYFVTYNNGEIKWIETVFPHFAHHGTAEAKKASYIKKKSKKVVEVNNRVEINFNDDPINILKVYVKSENTPLNKDVLLKEGCRLLNRVTQST
jgi:DNA repair exonuclease SbcCD nuclease subunit